MTYVELIKRIDRIFPSTVDCDYRNVTYEELWRKLYNLLEKMDILKKFKDDELKELREIIHYEQKGNYRRKNIVEANRGSDYDYGYNQNNYVIKQSVLRIKEQVLNTILNKSRLRYDLIVDEYDAYNSNIGGIKDIENFIDPEDIEEYITKLLTISKEDNDYYKFEPSLFTRNILLHYGFNPNSNELNKLVSEVNRRISSILFSNTNTMNNKIEESLVVDKKDIKDLVELLTKATRNNLDNRTRDEFSISSKENQKHIAFEKIDKIKNYENQVEEQQRLVDRNRKIIEELRRLEEKKLELQKELEENTAKMAKL